MCLRKKICLLWILTLGRNEIPRSLLLSRLNRPTISASPQMSPWPRWQPPSHLGALRWICSSLSMSLVQRSPALVTSHSACLHMMLYTKHIPYLTVWHVPPCASDKHKLERLLFNALCQVLTLPVLETWQNSSTRQQTQLFFVTLNYLPMWRATSPLFPCKLTFFECCCQQWSSLWSFSRIRFDKEVRFYMNILKPTHISQFCIDMQLLFQITTDLLVLVTQ